MKFINAAEKLALAEIIEIIYSLADDEDIINEEVFNKELKNAIAKLSIIRRNYFLKN